MLAFPYLVSRSVYRKGCIGHNPARRDTRPRPTWFAEAQWLPPGGSCRRKATEEESGKKGRRGHQPKSWNRTGCPNSSPGPTGHPLPGRGYSLALTAGCGTLLPSVQPQGQQWPVQCEWLRFVRWRVFWTQLRTHAVFFLIVDYVFSEAFNISGRRYRMYLGDFFGII